jgi:hypothetical protein
MKKIIVIGTFILSGCMLHSNKNCLEITEVEKKTFIIEVKTLIEQYYYLNEEFPLSKEQFDTHLKQFAPEHICNFFNIRDYILTYHNNDRTCFIYFEENLLEIDFIRKNVNEMYRMADLYSMAVVSYKYSYVRDSSEYTINRIAFSDMQKKFNECYHNELIERNGGYVRNAKKPRIINLLIENKKDIVLKVINTDVDNIESEELKQALYCFNNNLKEIDYLKNINHLYYTLILYDKSQLLFGF